MKKMRELLEEFLQEIGEDDELFGEKMRELRAVELVQRDEIKEERDRYERWLTRAIEVIGFYASADTYFAIAFLADEPCGELVSDFSETELGQHPGKRARELLEEFLQEIGEDDEK